jgi:hypothetical protein
MIGAVMTAGEAYLGRWARLGEAARRARAVQGNRIAALAIVVLYNAAGFADIASTAEALSLGAQEANPVVRGFMAALADYWAAPKLASQALVTAMILWFPHRIVLGVFSVAVAATAAVVVNNYHIIASL